MTVHDLGAGLPLSDDAARSYDAVLVLSFGGPDGRDDVMPFLENVTRGRAVPRARLEAVARHYHEMGGASPLNAQNRALIAALEDELARAGHTLPVYFGNRNWHPFVTDTVRDMRDDGIRRAAVFVTSAYSCYSGCRQYREDLQRAGAAVDGAPELDKLRVFYNHPAFIEANADRLRAALDDVPAARRAAAHVAFTAHSIPVGQARHSAYVRQLEETARLVADGAGIGYGQLVYQSRSGPPAVPWLEPDIGDHLAALARNGVADVVVQPIGFLSDHMEIVYDLDREARARADELGIRLVRARTAGTHPAFVRMIRELIEERMAANPTRPALGAYPANHDHCPVGCCLEQPAAGGS